MLLPDAVRGMATNQPVTWSNTLGTEDHEGGTLPLGGILDDDGEFRSVRGLYAAGPATFPRLGAANPSLTTLALVHRARGDAGGSVMTAEPHPQHDAFRAMLLGGEYPCLGGSAAIRRGHYACASYPPLGSAAAMDRCAADLAAFLAERPESTHPVAVYVAVFAVDGPSSEVDFEQRLWQQLAGLRLLDTGPVPRAGPTWPVTRASVSAAATCSWWDCIRTHRATPGGSTGRPWSSTRCPMRIHWWPPGSTRA